MPRKAFILEFVDHVLDNVHGFIDMTIVEKEIIDLPVFKRLQSIKQLSLVSWIFPGAEHTRYIHSLGVMSIIDKMACKLGYSDEDRQLVRLAALLHDIGHYPLSHAGERAYILEHENSSDDYIAHTNQKTLESIKEIESPRCSTNSKKSTFHHENIGQEIIINNADIKRIIKKRCPFIKIDDLCAIITGNYDYDAENSYRLSDKIQLLHSELDADRVDYLLRDSTFSGARYGAFDFGVVLKNLKICKHNNAAIVGVLPKGISAIDQYQINRFFSYTQVVFNRHVLAIDTMVVILMRYIIRNKICDWLSPDELYKGIQENKITDYFMTLNDNAFWNAVHEIDMKELRPKCPQYIKKIANMLILHREIQNIENFEVMLNNGDDSSEIAKKLMALYEKICDNSGVCVMPVNKLTPHLGIEEYLEMLKNKKLNDSEIEKFLLKRYQEGLVIIDGPNKYKLIIDDVRSISRAVRSVRAVAFRQYYIKPA